MPPLSPSETGHQTSDQYVQPAMGFPDFSFWTCSNVWPPDKILDPGLRATFTFFTHRSKDRRLADATPATCHRNYLSLYPFCQNEERRWGGWRGKAESGLSNGRRWCGAQRGEKEKGREETASNRMESKKGRKGREWNWGSDLIFSRPRSEGWPHYGRTFSIYPCPLSF